MELLDLAHLFEFTLFKLNLITKCFQNTVFISISLYKKMKNNIKSFSSIQNNGNILAKSRSSLGLRMRPLSEIENSIEKTKKRR
jgi:hypothetical protein